MLEMRSLCIFSQSIYSFYDIHSPRVPKIDEMLDLLRCAARVIPVERLWANPDCGLKTRCFEEVLPALTNLVEAAKQMRAQVLNAK
ncbi:MAG: hypothetical protein JW841_00190 [Deltaproteobacteria bacterium]|nr:hypothetical protein [Deltaproteobacteria bacterium]